MAQNINPVFLLVPVVSWGTLMTAANTAMDGTGTVVTIFTADATNGGRCDEIRFKAAGTNVTTVARIFINIKTISRIIIRMKSIEIHLIGFFVCDELLGFFTAFR